MSCEALVAKLMKVALVQVGLPRSFCTKMKVIKGEENSSGINNNGFQPFIPKNGYRNDEMCENRGSGPNKVLHQAINESQRLCHQE